MELLKRILFVSIVISVISCSFIQKTKVGFHNSRFLMLYSFLINMIISILFCMTFTNFPFVYSLWVGLFSFLGADTIFKVIKRKLTSYQDLRK